MKWSDYNTLFSYIILQFDYKKLIRTLNLVQINSFLPNFFSNFDSKNQDTLQCTMYTEIQITYVSVNRVQLSKSMQILPLPNRYMYVGD